MALRCCLNILLDIQTKIILAQNLKPGQPSLSFDLWKCAYQKESVNSPFLKLSALKVARKAETLSPLGALFYNTGRYEEALQIYREAAALQPSHRELRLALVSAWAKHMRLGADAERAVEGAVVSRPQNGNRNCYTISML